MVEEHGIKDWKYYNHALIPKTAPHEMPDTSPLTNGSVWQIGGVFRY